MNTNPSHTSTQNTLKRFAAATLLVGTGFAGALTIGTAGAQDDTTTTVVSQDTGADTAGNEASGEKSNWADDVFADLVADGTLTQEQADTTKDALAEARPERDGRGHRRGHQIVKVLEELGIDANTVKAGVQDGKTIGVIAEENGVDVSAVVDALVENAQERIAVAVENERMTQAQADEKLETLEADITERINAVREQGEREGADGERGRRGPRGDRGGAEQTPAEDGE